MTDNVYTYLVKLPPGVNEMVTPCQEGYTVYINERQTWEQQCLAYHHAVKHINRNDFELFEVGKIEKAAHE